MIAVTTLHDTLLGSCRDGFTSDAVGVIDSEVAGKRGAAGLAVKAGYGAINRLNPELVYDALDVLLPEFVDRLDHHWRDFRATGIGSFGAFLAERGNRVAEELLEATDAKVAGSTMHAVKRVYSTMRPAAKRHVTDALPRLGDVIEKYAG